MSDTDPTSKKVGYEFVSNKIEMKFEQTLLLLESQEPPNFVKINVFHKYRKCIKILDDAPYHPGLTDHILALSQKYLENLEDEQPISEMLFGLSLFKKS